MPTFPVEFSELLQGALCCGGLVVVGALGLWVLLFHYPGGTKPYKGPIKYEGFEE